MLGFGKKTSNKIPILATQTGDLIGLESVPDNVFAQKVLGEGVAIIPQEDMVRSPVSGIVVDITDTKHAVCLTAEDGTDFLVHVGIDTVKLKGEGFEALVQAGDKVKAGDPILKVNLQVLKNNGVFAHTPTVIADMEGITLWVENQSKVVAGQTVVAYYQRG